MNQIGGKHYCKITDDQEYFIFNDIKGTELFKCKTLLRYFDSDTGMKFDRSKNWVGMIFWGKYDVTNKKGYTSWAESTYRNLNEAFNSGNVILRCTSDFDHDYELPNINNSKYDIVKELKKEVFKSKNKKQIRKLLDNEYFFKYNPLIQKKPPISFDKGNPNRIRDPHKPLFETFMQETIHDYFNYHKDLNLVPFITGISYYNGQWKFRSGQLNSSNHINKDDQIFFKDYISHHLDILKDNSAYKNENQNITAKLELLLNELVDTRSIYENKFNWYRTSNSTGKKSLITGYYLYYTQLIEIDMDNIGKNIPPEPKKHECDITKTVIKKFENDDYRLFCLDNSNYHVSRLYNKPVFSFDTHIYFYDYKMLLMHDRHPR